MLVFIGKNLIGDVWYLDVERTAKGVLISKIRTNGEIEREFDLIVEDAFEVLDIVAKESLRVRALLDVAEFLGVKLSVDEAVEWIKDAILETVADVDDESAVKMALSTLRSDR